MSEIAVKPELLDILGRYGKVELVEYRPKQRSKYKVSFDQGVYQGSNVTTFSYQNLDPLFVAIIIAGESAWLKDELNEIIMNYFRKTAKPPTP